jgi:hypothetical protein
MIAIRNNRIFGYRKTYKPMSTTKSIRPTESELEILQILWAKWPRYCKRSTRKDWLRLGCWIYHYA